MTGIRTRRAVLPDPHHFNREPKTGLCLDCPLPEAHEVHSQAAIAAAEAQRQGWLAHDQRKTGDRT